jgi:serine/threonine-protein kinase
VWVHRDIKPENVLLSEQHAVVTDFGIAKALAGGQAGAWPAGPGNTLTEAGLALGTPAYMAPEQATAHAAVDHRTDLYALGVVAYELLTGQPPFAGRTAATFLAAQVTQQPEPVTHRRPGVPPPVGDLVMRLLAKRPADRPQSADEVVHALDQPASAPAPPLPTTLAVPVQSGARRRRVAAAVLLLLVAGVGAAVMRARHRPRVEPSGAVIAVMPFAPATTDTALARLGRDLVVTLSTTLDGIAGGRTVDALTVLAQVRSSEQVPSLRGAAELSRRLGAKSLLHGTLVRVGANRGSQSRRV